MKNWMIWVSALVYIASAANATTSLSPFIGNKYDLASYAAPEGSWGWDYAFDEKGNNRFALAGEDFQLGVDFNERKNGFENYFLGWNIAAGIIDWGTRLNAYRPHLPAGDLKYETNWGLDFSLSLRSNDVFFPYAAYEGLGLDLNLQVVRYGIEVRPLGTPDVYARFEFQDSVYAGDIKRPGDQGDVTLGGTLFGFLQLEFQAPLREFSNANRARFSLGFNLGNYDLEYHHVNKTRAYHLGYLYRNPKGNHRNEANWIYLSLEQSPSLVDRADWFDNTPHLTSILQTLEAAKENDLISGLWLEVLTPLSSAQSDQLLFALKSLKKAGKTVWLSVEDYNGATLLLSTQADRVILHPQGRFSYMGLGIQTYYFKHLLDSLGVEFQVIRAGKYKNAMEPFVSDSMSTGFIEEITRLLKRRQEDVFSEVGARGKLSLDSVQNHWAIPNLSPEAAVARGYADTLMSSAEIEAQLNQQGIVLKTFDLLNTPLPNRNYSRNQKVAIVPIEGTLVSGQSGSGLMGGDYTGDKEFAARLRYVASTNPEAILLVMNTPGGSVTAAEKMREEILKIKRDLDIPIYATVQGVAASGGTLLLTAVDQIFVLPGSITGSIGVFMAKPNASELFKKLGIHPQEILMGPSANAQGINRNFTAVESLAVKEYIDSYYSRFKDIVASARHITPESMDTLAQGRVYTGTEAVENGLADSLGGFTEALNALLKKIDSDPQHYSALWFSSLDEGAVAQWSACIQSWINPKFMDSPAAFNQEPLIRLMHEPLLSWSPWLLPSSF